MIPSGGSGRKMDQVTMATEPQVSIVIADSHAILRAALRELLTSIPGFRVGGEAADGREAAKLTRQRRPDVLLLNLIVPGPLGEEVFAELNSSVERPRIVLVTSQIENAELAKAFLCGVRGVILKNSSVAVLVQGIRAVAADECWVGTTRVTDPGALFRAPGSARPAKVTFGLTAPELQVVRAALAGYGIRDIADRLSMDRDTAKHHFASLYEKLGVTNRLELALFAAHHRIASDASNPQESAKDARNPSWRQAG